MLSAPIRNRPTARLNGCRLSSPSPGALFRGRVSRSGARRRSGRARVDMPHRKSVPVESSGAPSRDRNHASAYRSARWDEDARVGKATRVGGVLGTFDEEDGAARVYNAESLLRFNRPDLNDVSAPDDSMFGSERWTPRVGTSSSRLVSSSRVHRRVRLNPRTLLARPLSPLRLLSPLSPLCVRGPRLVHLLYPILHAASHDV